MTSTNPCDRCSQPTKGPGVHMRRRGKRTRCSHCKRLCCHPCLRSMSVRNHTSFCQDCQP